MPSERDFPAVLHDTCRPYALQMRRNELKHGFYCQNPACFGRIYLSILRTKESSTSFKQHPPAEFHGQKMLNMINLTNGCTVCCHGAIILLSNARGLGCDSRPRKLFLFSSLFCFCFSFLKTYFHILGDLNYKLIMSFSFLK